MKKILLSLALLFLAGCGPTTYTEVVQQASRSGYNYTALAEPRSWIGQNQGGYGASKVSQEHANNLAMSFCQNNHRDCVLTYEGNNWVLYKKEEKLNTQKIENIVELKDENNQKVKEKVKTEKQSTIVELGKLYSETCSRTNKKDSDKYNSCLLEKHTEAKQLAEKVSKMSPDDRRAFTCSDKFGFRKGSDKFKDCVFKIYAAEIEMEKLELQKELAKANAETAKARAEAARASDDRQERLLQAQTEAAKMQALAARQQAIAANTAESMALIESGLRMMSPQQSAPRMQTNCTFTGRFMNCY